jgi:hypothetical protein
VEPNVLTKWIKEISLLKGVNVEMESFEKFLKKIKKVGDEIFETATHRAKLRTIFDAYTEEVIPTFVKEEDLKEYYEKQMENVNEFIYKL